MQGGIYLFLHTIQKFDFPKNQTSILENWILNNVYLWEGISWTIEDEASQNKFGTL